MEKKFSDGKTGFAAYEEINALARSVYGSNVRTTSAIMGDDYEITVGSATLHHGTTAEVRAALLGFGMAVAS